MLRGRALQITPYQLEGAFDGLCLYSVLRRDGPKYTFAAQAFPDLLRRSQDIQGLIPSLVHQLQTEGADQ
jgi:hypothetical protein